MMAPFSIRVHELMTTPAMMAMPRASAAEVETTAFGLTAFTRSKQVCNTCARSR
jgi:hypothetical protein